MQTRRFARISLTLALVPAFSLSLSAADVRTDKDVYYVLDPIVVAYSGMQGNSNDWISVALASHTDRQYIQYKYTGGAASGTMTFNAMQDPGDYQVRAYFKDSYTVEVRRAFKVIYPTPQMSTDKPSYLVREPVTVNYSGLPGYPDDYITIVPANSPDNTYWEYYKAGGKKSGSMKFVRELAPGDYEARLHYRNEDPIVRLRVRFTVAYPKTQISVDKPLYKVLEPVTVSYSNMPGWPDDWITVVPASSANTVYWEYYKTGGKLSGGMKFTRALDPGQYEARAFYKNEYTVRVRAPFTVEFPATHVRTDRTVYAVGDPITVSYAEMPGYSDDYITIVPAASADNTYWEWYKTGGNRSGTMTFRNKLEAGRYEARVHYRNEDAIVRARYQFGVEAAPCTLSLSPASAGVAAAGGSGSIAITAGSADCAWTAASSDPSWLTVSPSSGKGSATLSYSAKANASANSRVATISVSGQVFTLTQSGAVPAGEMPIITSVVHGASRMPAATAAGAIAQGGIFSIIGTGLGPGSPADPASAAVASGPPLSTTLANVSVRVTQGGRGVDAYPLSVWAGRIDAIMPSNAPAGNVFITVTYKDTAGAAFPAMVVNSNFHAFSAAGNGIGRGVVLHESDPPVRNSNDVTARPGQNVSLLGTGLGPIAAADNLAPPAGELPAPVEVLVAGKLATRLSSGRLPGQPGQDQIRFQVPADAPPGCNVPVQVRSGGTYSNTVTMAIEAEGKPCASMNPWSGVAATGGRHASIFLIRAAASVELMAGMPLDLTLDLGLAAFNEVPPGGDQILSVVSALPPVGTCTAAGGSLDLGNLLGGALGGGTAQLPGGVALSKELDAGPVLTITGPAGSMPLPKMDPEANTGPYAALLGGSIPLGEGAPSLPPFLEPGSYTISGAGGKDVGPFTASLTVPPAIQWTNRNDLAAIDRAAGLALRWTGGDSAQLIAIAGAATDQKTKAAGGFLCLANAADGSFQVPPSVLANLPPIASQSLEDSLGALMLGVIPAGGLNKFTANGIDEGYVFYGLFNIRTVTVQ